MRKAWSHRHIGIWHYHNEDLDDIQKAQSEFLLAYPDFKDNPDFLRQMIIFFNVQNNDEITKQLLERYLKLAPEDDEMQDLYNNL